MALSRKQVSINISSVVGLDWQGLSDTMISGQLFQSYLLDKNPGTVRPQRNNIMSLMYRQSFENETWELELLTLYGLDKNDSSVQFNLSYMVESNIKVWLGIDVFSGDAESLFGQFDSADRLTMGVEWGL